MSLVGYAEEELRRAGFFEEDSYYAGMIGPAVVEMMKQFAEEGHSGYLAHIVLQIFERLARFRPLTQIDNPMILNEFLDHTEISGGHATFQSTRLSSLFSEDGGKRWYDIDKRLPRWKKWLRIRRSYINFPYMPK